MSKDMVIVAVGLWITFIPYLGVPSSWRTALLIMTGIGLVLFGLSIRREALKRGFRRSGRTGEEQHHFVESALPHDSPSPQTYERKEGIGSLN